MARGVSAPEHFPSVCKPENSTGAKPRKATINFLPDELLLEVFSAHLRQNSGPQPTPRQWFQTVPAHVCRRWRQLIIMSPRRLGLYVLCCAGAPISDLLDHSPPSIPLKLDYHDWTPATKGDILLTLGHLSRVRDISLSAEIIALRDLLSRMDSRAPQLEKLDLISSGTSQFLSIPHTFLDNDAPQIRVLHLTNVLPLLTLTSNIVVFTFGVDGFKSKCRWFDDVLSSICAMSRLERLVLMLGAQPFSWIKSEQPPAVTPLLQLYYIDFSGATNHLEALSSRIDAPYLNDFHVDVILGLSATPAFSRFISNASLLRPVAAQLEITRRGLIIESCPTSEIPHVRFLVYWGPDADMRFVNIIARALEPLFSEADTLALGLSDNRVARALLSNTMADSVYWTTFFPNFSAARVMWVDEDILPVVTTALESGTALPTSVRHLCMCFHARDIQYGAFLEEHVERFHSVITRLCDGVDVRCKDFNDDEWPDRLTNLSEAYFGSDSDPDADTVPALGLAEQP
ncbi:hypothetical protein BC834DRAFT_911882 [Gloeopeniophorella convolvens]|nr:hypothetical protein BC834DRAFT_911882 [Gloeopeniophorella convolvens]